MYTGMPLGLRRISAPKQTETVSRVDTLAYVRHEGRCGVPAWNGARYARSRVA